MITCCSSSEVPLRRDGSGDPRDKRQDVELSEREQEAILYSSSGDPEDKIPFSSSGPRDRTLAAYKEWILEINRRLATSKEEIQFTEKEWRESWQEYWIKKSAN
jgi:hypothetical protein